MLRIDDVTLPIFGLNIGIMNLVCGNNSIPLNANFGNFGSKKGKDRIFEIPDLIFYFCSKNKACQSN